MRKLNLSYQTLFLVVLIVMLMMSISVSAQETTESTQEVTDAPPTEAPLPTETPVPPLPTETPLPPPTEAPLPTSTTPPTEVPVEATATSSGEITITPVPTEEVIVPLPTTTETPDVGAQVFQGQLYFGQTVFNRCMSGTGHEWSFWFDTTYSYMIDIQRVSGNLRYNLSIPGVVGSTPSSVDGRSIYVGRNGAASYEIRLAPNAGTSGCYNIAIWQNGIPNLSYSLGWQSSYSNINRWQFHIPSNQAYYVEVQRTDGSLEYIYEIRNRSTNQVVSGTNASSYNGQAVVAASTGTGWHDFHMNFGSTSGSYRVRIVQGVRPIDAPTITAPTANQVVGTSFTANVRRIVGNGRGSLRYRLQIAATCSFNPNVYDQTGTQPTFNVTLPAGNYCARAFQGNSLGEWSGASSTVQFTVLPAPALLAPANNSNTSNQQPNLTWSPVQGAASYELQIGTTNPPTGTVIPVAGTAYTPATPLSEQSHFWRVRTVHSNGAQSAWSAVWRLNISTPANAIPLLNQFNGPQVTLQWSSITWATGYQVDIATDNRFRSIVHSNNQLNANTLSLTTPSLAPGTYFWRVRPRQADGRWGGWSNTGTGTFTIES